MEKIKQTFCDMSMHRAFVVSVLTTVIAALFLSGMTIYGCLRLQNWLMPKKEQAVLSVQAKSADGSSQETLTVILTAGEELPFGFSTTGEEEQKYVSYTLEKVEQTYRSLTPKRQLLYLAASGAMILLPTFYCFSGIILCAFFFYREKLERPLIILGQAADQMTKQNLDFEIIYNSKDEMGRLCDSFERMRAALADANREMWQMMEEREKLQASIAHDLRNPIAIIKGYTEYLKLHLPKGCVSQEQCLTIADHMASAAGRMEAYTESVRSLHTLEAIRVMPEPCQLSDFLTSVGEEMKLLAEADQILLRVTTDGQERASEIMLDREAYCRVLENIVRNGIRYARSCMNLIWQWHDGRLITVVTDDGPGFSENVLKRREKHRFLPDIHEEHMGMGLVISEIICRKHGGTLKLANLETGGARAEFVFYAERADKK